MKLSSILGLNARTQLYAYKYNTIRGKKVADSKILTAQNLKAAGVAHPKIFKIFKNPEDVFKFDWENLPDKFALKPSRGLGGEGIVVVKKRLKSQNSELKTQNPAWLTTQKEKVSTADLKLHTLDILEGAYSMGTEPDSALIQEYVGRADVFKKWAYRGTPDIRVIVFNKVPVMAMLRLPTKESGGRANLHQGAVGVGVDIATGITTKSIWHGEQIVFKPGTSAKLRGIKIPDWDSVLTTAVKASIAARLGYAGIDIVIHPEKGPMVLEMNAQPGLQIQLANMEGLRSRLNRIDDLNVTTAEHGVRVSKVLFAGRFIDINAAEKGVKKISVWEQIYLISASGKRKRVWAKVDTGAWRTSIDKDLAKSLGLLTDKNILWTRNIRTSIGREEREVINLNYLLAGRKVATLASVSSRRHLRVPVIIGRRDLAGFLITSINSKRSSDFLPPMWKGQ